MTATAAMRRPDGTHRVVVTGLGAVSGFGIGVAALARGLFAGTSAIRPTTRTFDDMSITLPASTIDYDPFAHFTPAALVMRERFVQLGLMAADEAVAASGLSAPALAGAAIVFGCGGGGELTREETAVQLFHHRRPRAHPMTVPRTNHQAVVSHVAAEHGIGGPSFVIATGCAASAHAIAQAAAMVRFGQAPCALAGGTEAPVHYSVMRAFQAARTVAETCCRPFSAGRDGFALGEGSAVLVLETLEGALSRGATIIAEVAGAGMSTDPSDQVHPVVAGPARAIRAALADSGIAPETVDYINAHGTATPLNDAVETQAVKEVYGTHASSLLMSSTKSQIGHTFGAAGALELTSTLIGMRDGFAPPTVNYLGPDAACDLDCVPNAPRQKSINTAMSHSFAFGGLNVALAVRRLDPSGTPEMN
jgi:nodulation protein E